MAGMQTYQPVDRSFFETARFSFTVEVELGCSPAQLFTIFEDAHAWTVWADTLKKVEWTSAKPFGPGATRTVTLPGGRVADEVFFAWERGKHMAFYFERGNMPLEAFAENYDVTDLGDGRCKLRWAVALIPTGAGKVLLPIFRPVMQWQLNAMMKSLQKYVAQQSFEGEPELDTRPTQA